MLKQIQTINYQADLLHQIATPLTSVMLNLEDLRATDFSDNPKLTSSIEEMKKVFELLRTRESQVLSSMTFCPTSLVSRLVSDYRKPYQVKCRFRTRGKNKQVLFYGCPEAFLEIVMHLLNNAAEAYCANLVGREIFVDLMPAMNGLNLVISDNGRGIDWWQKPIIKSKGISFKTVKSGLGLYKVAYLVRKQFGGKLRIISFPHRGTIVIAHFPLR